MNCSHDSDDSTHDTGSLRMIRATFGYTLPQDLGLVVDLYELTMAQSYFHRGMNGWAVFDYFIREQPPTRRFFLFAGLESLLAALEDLRFSREALAYLRTLGLFQPDFLEYLERFRFQGDIYSVEEGEVVFAGEVILRVEAPLVEAQIVETLLLNTLNFQTLIASKAARVVLAAQGRGVVDFSPRRDHGVDAALKVARASYIAGCLGTSYVHAGKVFGIPVFGTMAHAYVMAFPSELDAFLTFAREYPQRPIFLVDTYDVVDGVRHAIEAARILEREHIRVFGIRIDSGDLVALSRKARTMLREAGLSHVRILLSGDLDEYRIRELLDRGAQVDSFGVGTRMGTSSDTPYVGGVYKLVEYEGRPRIKRSPGKQTWPGRKQVYRQEGRDVVALEDEAVEGRPLLRKVMERGRALSLPPLTAIREHARQRLEALPERLRQIDPLPEGASPLWEVTPSPGIQKLLHTG